MPSAAQRSFLKRTLVVNDAMPVVLALVVGEQLAPVEDAHVHEVPMNPTPEPALRVSSSKQLGRHFWLQPRSEEGEAAHEHTAEAHDTPLSLLRG